MLIAEKCVTECFFAFLKIDEKPILELQKQAAKFDIKKQKLGIFCMGKINPSNGMKKKEKNFQKCKETDFVQCFSMCVKMIIKETLCENVLSVIVKLVTC